MTASLSGGSIDTASLALRNDASGGQGGVGNSGTIDGGAGGDALASGRTALAISGGSFTVTTLFFRSTNADRRGGDGSGARSGEEAYNDIAVYAEAASVSIAGRTGEPAPSTTMISSGDGGDGGADATAGTSGGQGAGAGGRVTLTTDGVVTAMLADADLESSPPAGRSGAPGLVTVSALDDSGNAPATPLTFTSLTATTAAATTIGATLVIDSIAPIAVSDTTRLDTSGAGGRRHPVASLSGGTVALTSSAAGIDIAGGLSAAGSITFVASTLRTGAVSGADVRFDAGAINTGDVTASSGDTALAVGMGDLATGALRAGGAVDLSSAGMIATRAVAASGNVTARR